VAGPRRILTGFLVRAEHGTWPPRVYVECNVGVEGGWCKGEGVPVRRVGAGLLSGRTAGLRSLSSA